MTLYMSCSVSFRNAIALIGGNYENNIVVRLECGIRDTKPHQNKEIFIQIKYIFHEIYTYTLKDHNYWQNFDATTKWKRCSEETEIGLDIFVEFARTGVEQTRSSSQAGRWYAWCFGQAKMLDKVWTTRSLKPTNRLFGCYVRITGSPTVPLAEW